MRQRNCGLAIAPNAALICVTPSFVTMSDRNGARTMVTSSNVLWYLFLFSFGRYIHRSQICSWEGQCIIYGHRHFLADLDGNRMLQLAIILEQISVITMRIFMNHRPLEPDLKAVGVVLNAPMTDPVLLPMRQTLVRCQMELKESR